MRILAHYPENQRSQGATACLFAVRRGAGNPAAVRAAVLAEVRGRLGARGREDAAMRTQRATLMQHRADALNFAGWALDWAALPREERERQQGERGDRHRREGMDTQPAPPTQRDSLRARGYTSEIRSKAHASQLIGGPRRGRVA